MNDRTVSILPALVSFGLLNHKDVVARKASNIRLAFNISIRSHSSYGSRWLRDHPLTCTKRTFWQKNQINLTQWITQSFVQNKAGEVLCRRGFWILWVKTEKNDQHNVTRCNVERNSAHPWANFFFLLRSCQFLEWPLSITCVVCNAHILHCCLRVVPAHRKRLMLLLLNHHLSNIFPILHRHYYYILISCNFPCLTTTHH